MAKKKRRSAAKSQKSASEPAKVLEAVQRLRDRYALGLRVLKEDASNPDNRKYSKGVSLRIAKELGVQPDYVDKARKFAKVYTPKELEDLCNLRRPDGMPLGTSLIIPLLKVKDKRMRARLQRQAVAKGWGKKRLEQELALIPSDRPSSGGRRPAKASTVEQALVQVLQRAEQWRRWAQGFESDKEGEDTVSLADLPTPVRAGLAAASRSVNRLAAAAKEALGKTTPAQEQ